ncbi:MAG: hypothetical protein ACFFBP_00915 [Promethearchaeota archaeon]
MQERKKEKRIKGIGGIIAKMMKPLETDEVFLAKFSQLEMKALINAHDTKYAAIVNFNQGKIDVEAVKNDPVENISKKTLHWDGKLETEVAILLQIATGEIGLLGLVKLIMTRKVKIKGLFKMLSLYNVFKIAGAKEKSIKEPSKEVARKARIKSTTLFSRRSKFITAGVLGIVLPSILSLLFMWALGDIRMWWELSYGNLGLFYSLVIFNVFNLVSDMILLGYGYWYVFIIWAVTGIFIGILSRDILKSLIIDLIAIVTNVILYTIFITIFSSFFPDNFVHSLITKSSIWYPGLIEGFVSFFFIFAQITLDSFALPMLVLFTLIGGIINPKPEYYTVLDVKQDIRIKKKFKGSIIPSKQINSTSQNRGVSIEEKSRVRAI